MKSKQLSPFTLSAGLDNGLGLNFGIQRDMNDRNRLGYAVNFQFGTNKFIVSPTVTYKFNKEITLSLSTSFDTTKQI